MNVSNANLLTDYYCVSPEIRKTKTKVSTRQCNVRSGEHKRKLERLVGMHQKINVCDIKGLVSEFQNGNWNWYGNLCQKEKGKTTQNFK